MPSTLRFSLYPSNEQEERMLRTLKVCRQLWNDALFHRKMRWEKERKSTSYNLQQWILTAERHVDPALGEVYSQTAQDVLHRLDKAFRAFFEHKARYPRFKKHREYGSFTYPQGYKGSVKPDVPRKRLYLSKVGNVRAVFHRPLPREARLKTCSVVREPDGTWYASLVYEEVVPLQGIEIPVGTAVQKTFTSPVGIDLGLSSLITTSEGVGIPHPKFLSCAERRLKHLQRECLRKKKGSKNWFKARQRLASQHARVRHQRADFNHKLSHQLVKGHDLIAFEDLRIRNMVRNHALAKSIHDAGWGQFVRFTEYRATDVRKPVVRVPSAYSTQECYHCGTLNPVGLSVRKYECVGCHQRLNRDINAARVVLKRALAQVGQGMPELKPVETEPLPVQSTGRASPVFEAGTRSPRLWRGRMPRGPGG